MEVCWETNQFSIELWKRNILMKNWTDGFLMWKQTFQILMSVLLVLSNVISMPIASTLLAVMTADAMMVLRELGKFVAVSSMTIQYILQLSPFNNCIIMVSLIVWLILYPEICRSSKFFVRWHIFDICF